MAEGDHELNELNELFLGDMKQPTFLTRQDMERIAEQDINPALLPSDEIARKIKENDIRISVTINK